jgi:hypothetical protein
MRLFSTRPISINDRTAVLRTRRLSSLNSAVRRLMNAGSPILPMAHAAVDRIPVWSDSAMASARFKPAGHPAKCSPSRALPATRGLVSPMHSSRIRIAAADFVPQDASTALARSR